MGIRFLCPNGHKLNVKAFLAGERGICPQCDAKFLVPSESGGQVEAISEAAIAATESANVTASPNPAPRTPATTSAAESTPSPPPPPAPTPPAVTPPPPPEPEQPPEVWYVRAATGEQFGPASVEVMREWVAEGRVTVDCHVWRTGWPDWKTGGQAITQLNVVPPAADITPPNTAADTSAETPASAAEPQANTSAALSASPGELPAASNPTASYQATKRLRQERARKITLLLGVLVLILFAVLIGVLMNNR